MVRYLQYRSVCAATAILDAAAWGTDRPAKAAILPCERLLNTTATRSADITKTRERKLKCLCSSWHPRTTFVDLSSCTEGVSGGHLPNTSEEKSSDAGEFPLCDFNCHWRRMGLLPTVIAAPLELLTQTGSVSEGTLSMRSEPRKPLA